jgi:hypothetical protein
MMKPEIEKLEADIRTVDREIEDRKLALVALQMGMNPDGELEDEELVELCELRKKLSRELDRLTGRPTT